MSSDKNKRDKFHAPVIEALSKRASYICSNPDCRCFTLAPSDAHEAKFILIGEAAHITAASSDAPRFDSSLTQEQRSGIENGIFLCANCATMIDKNKGLDFPTSVLKEWKQKHELWVKENLNKKQIFSEISVIDGEHYAKGMGTVTAIDARKPVFMKPGTKAIAEGCGNITATRIGGKE